MLQILPLWLTGRPSSTAIVLSSVLTTRTSACALPRSSSGRRRGNQNIRWRIRIHFEEPDVRSCSGVLGMKIPRPDVCSVCYISSCLLFSFELLFFRSCMLASITASISFCTHVSECCSGGMESPCEITMLKIDGVRLLPKCLVNKIILSGLIRILRFLA